MSRCTGHCCKKFYLPYEPDELVEFRKRNEGGTIKLAQDNVKVCDMVIPLGPLNGKDVNGDPYKGLVNGYYYTCKNYKDGNCSIYETRPYVCSDYPYEGHTCKYKACTWDKDDQIKETWNRNNWPRRLLKDPEEILNNLLKTIKSNQNLDSLLDFPRNRKSRSFQIPSKRDIFFKKYTKAKAEEGYGGRGI
jgi:Fe-S-cluster containining protein